MGWKSWFIWIATTVKNTCRPCTTEARAVFS
jgi:hypothetical protein